MRSKPDRKAGRQQVKDCALSRLGLEVGKLARQTLIRQEYRQGMSDITTGLTNSRTVIVLDYAQGEMAFLYSSATKEIVSFCRPDAPEMPAWRRSQAELACMRRGPDGAHKMSAHSQRTRRGKAGTACPRTWLRRRRSWAPFCSTMAITRRRRAALPPPISPSIPIAVLFLRMGELMGEGKSVDIVTLAEQLQRNKELSVIGGVAYLASLTEGLPRRLSIEEYVRIVKDKSLLRQTIAERDRVATLAGDQSASAEEILAEAESGFRRIAGQAITSGLTSVGEYVKSHYPRIDEIFEHSARLTGIPSGFWWLDHLTAGFQPKELTILGARPSIGKTAVAGNIAVYAAMSGKTVAFFSLEMPSKALIDRMCCARGQVDLQAHRHGQA